MFERKRPGGWLHAPTQLELFAAADRRLTRVAGLAGLHIKRVEKVLPILVRGTKLLNVQATATDDLTATPVNRYTGSSRIWMNLVDLLGEAGLTVETGYRERNEVAYVPQTAHIFLYAVLAVPSVQLVTVVVTCPGGCPSPPAKAKSASWTRPWMKRQTRPQPRRRRTF